jgi:hypothetical protein
MLWEPESERTRGVSDNTKPKKRSDLREMKEKEAEENCVMRSFIIVHFTEYC